MTIVGILFTILAVVYLVKTMNRITNYVDLETSTYVIKGRTLNIEEFPSLFNELARKASSFLVLGKDFKYRMRLLRSGTAAQARWTAEKKINNKARKLYVSTKVPYITVGDLKTFYYRYKTMVEQEKIAKQIN